MPVFLFLVPIQRLHSRTRETFVRAKKLVGPKYPAKWEGMSPLERRVLLSGDPYVIDLMAVYTPQAKANRGGDAAIQSLIQSAVDVTNQALYDSLIPITIRLVHAEEITYTTSGDLSTDEDR